MIQSALKTDFCNFIRKRLQKAQYRIGSTWYDSHITGVLVKDDTIRVKCLCSIAEPCQINGIRLFNTVGELWDMKNVNITVSSDNLNLFIWFDYKIEEG